MDYKEKLQNIINSDNTPFVDIDTFLKYFPELKESEDERIRKAIKLMYSFLPNKPKYIGDVSVEDIFAWLEKQGQVKESAISQHENKMCKENDDSLTSEDERIRKALITFFQRFPYENFGDLSSSITEVISWLEKQGKNKDLPNVTDRETLDEYAYQVAYDLSNDWMKDTPTWDDVETACKLGANWREKQSEQRPTDEEMKELLRTEYEKGRADAIAEIQKSSTIDIDKMVSDYANNKERGNEEFGKPANCMVRAYRQGLNDAIGKVLLKLARSEEDEDILEDIEEAIINYWHGDTQDILLDWLKSLRPQKQWKPSEEHINALNVAIAYMTDESETPTAPKVLEELLEQLKEL